ncbi:hypothetical protein TWF696_003335 [Orbilia brochopaga]|uniref:Enoyl reductase (ER) domain-containing protein n=1 Tax=Orbilia brochopaga TaxID=3140254 RepID=A0AAV9TX85_9PEZI
MSNKAAWLMSPKAHPLTIGDASMPVAGQGEVIIRNHAIAINPVNWAIQALEVFPVSYPFIGGNDAAGEIVEVGPDVDAFKVGDRVLALAEGDGSREHEANAAFQLFFSAKVNRIAKIPNHTSYAEAAVFPLGMATAASALFQKDTHALPLPQVPPVPQTKTILVWGGSSSVGACAIQLLVGAGFEVAATAGAHNLEAMKDIGAKYVFDHKKQGVAEDIINDLGGTDFIGVFCAILEAEIIRLCGYIANKLGGNKFVSTVLPPTVLRQDGMPAGVETCNVWGTTLFENEVGPQVWGNWIYTALANGSLKPAPPPLVVGKGLESIQKACGRWRAGVSYQKVVVELD